MLALCKESKKYYLYYKEIFHNIYIRGEENKKRRQEKREGDRKYSIATDI